MYIDSLQVDHLRCFEHARLAFQYPGRDDEIARVGGAALLCPNLNLLLGDNGSGKTTILRTIALASLAPVIEGAGYVPYRVIRRKDDRVAPKARIQADLRLHGQDLGSKRRRSSPERRPSPRSGGSATSRSSALRSAAATTGRPCTTTPPPRSSSWATGRTGASRVPGLTIPAR